jgi:type I restriction enzyme M protein
MSVSSVIKSIQDIMRKDAGVDGDAQRLGQMSWLLFLKIFDAQEEELEFEQANYQCPLPEQYLWRNWAADNEGITGDELLEFVNDQLFPDLKNLTAPIKLNPRGYVAKEAFSDAFNYMKNGTLLRQVINKLNEIDFTDSEERHLFGDLYEQILKDLQSAGNAGEFYTPRAITRFIVDRVDPKLGESIMDPACGTGASWLVRLTTLKTTMLKLPMITKLYNSKFMA